MLKNSCNQLRRATVFAQPFGRAFLFAKGKSHIYIYDGCLPVILHSSELQHYRLATGRAAVTRIKAAAC